MEIKCSSLLLLLALRNGYVCLIIPARDGCHTSSLLDVSCHWAIVAVASLTNAFSCGKKFIFTSSPCASATPLFFVLLFLQFSSVARQQKLSRCTRAECADG